MSTPHRPRLEAAEEGARVTPLELFFDLVFVFSLTQVTALMGADLTGSGILRGLLVLAVLWWCWVGYSWLANAVRVDEGLARVALFAAMGALFVIALSIPESFDDLPGGLPGPVVFAASYFAVRVLHLGAFWLAAHDDPGLRRQLLRFTPPLVGGMGFLLLASQLDGTAQTAAWGAAIAADFIGTLLGGSSGWRVRSAGHFAERHGLIIIVALGESIVAIGVGVAGLPLSWPIVTASALGLTVAACLWWAYFDVVALVAERVLHAAQGEQRARMARDSYSYLHLPMIAGIVLLALGLKKVMEYVGDTVAHSLADPLPFLPLAALYGGAALYLLAHVAFRYRNVRTLNRQRVVVVAALVVLTPLVSPLPALGALALLAAILVGLITFEATRFANVRTQVRHQGEIAVSAFQRR